MKFIKTSAILLAASVTAVAVYGQTVGKAKKKVVKPAIVGNVHFSASSSQISPSMGAISALPLTGKELAERNEAYAPSDAFYQQAKSLYQSGDLTGAETACFQAFDAAPVIQGQRQHIPFVAGLLGEIYLKDGQYKKAIQWLQGSRPNTAGGSLNLNLALAYIRLGDYKHAQEFYSDQATLRYYPQGTSQDLPGIDSPTKLEASILLARGLDAYLEHRYDDALPDLQMANNLAPNNALIAYHCAQILTDKKQYDAAMPLYRVAATLGHGTISEEATRRYAGMQSNIKTIEPGQH